jgi:serine/threonine-protein kinase
MQVAGEQRALPLRVQPAGFNASPMYALASNGTLVYAEPAGKRSLIWIDREGREELVNAERRLYAHLRLSPDGLRVITYQPDGDRDLWILDLRQPGTVTRLTFGPTKESVAVWSNDGKRIFFGSDEHVVNAVTADGSGDVVTLFRGPRNHRISPISITPDGKTLLLHWQDETRQLDLRLLTLEPSPQVTPLLVDPSFHERDGRISPDGRWLAYATTESGASEIAVRPFPAVKEGKWVISSGGGQQPIWSRDGKELFYRTEDGTVMAVPIRPSSASFSYGLPVRLFSPRLTLHAVDMAPTYDVSPDGRRFMFMRAPELDIRSLTIVQNWDVQVKAAVTGGQRGARR